MGIVVALFMLVGLLMALPWVFPGLYILRPRSGVAVVLASGLLFAGLWNLLWYGLRHLSEFWGVAAFASGVVMSAVAVVLLIENGTEAWSRHYLIARTYAVLKPVRLPMLIVLTACFAIYTTALVRLNFGLSIPI